MSARDWKRDGDLLRGFVGRRLTCSLPTNSIKLMVDPEEHRHTFIWIDPPWQLFKGDRLVKGAADYPGHHLPDYVALHQEWVALVSPLLDGAVLEGVTQLEGVHTELRFEGGVRVHVADGGEPQGWYDDWYVRPSDSAGTEAR